MGERPFRLKALCVGCALLMSSPSWAVVIEPGQGEAFINQGHGFKPVKGQAKAKIGDTVMVRPGGAATVVYEDGCRVDVRPGAVTTVAPLSPCAASPEQPASCVPQAVFGALFVADIAGLFWLINGPTNNPSPARNCMSAC
jgi:hypothetical protein